MMWNWRSRPRGGRNSSSLRRLAILSRWQHLVVQRGRRARDLRYRIRDVRIYSRNGADNEALSASMSHSCCCQAFCLEQAHTFHHCSDMAVLEGHDLRAHGKSAHGIRKRLPTRCRYEEITIAE